MPAVRGIGLAAFCIAVWCGQVRAQTTVTYIQQTGNYPATYFNGTAGIFNSGTAAMGMFANSTGSKEAVAWRDFKTAGDNSGDVRSLQVGDRFTITMQASAAFGGMGFSLNDDGTQGSSYADRISGSRLYVQAVGTTASWEVNRSGGFTSLNYNVGSTRRDYTFEVTMTSESTANVQMLVDSGTYRAYNLTLNGTAGANIDAYSIWLKDDWNGSSNQNVDWKQETSVESAGAVELGYFLASGVFTPGLITDGLAADSTTTTSVNQVFVGGDAGSQVNLTQANTYTGATTVNANAAGEVQHADALGSTAAGTTVSSGGVLKLYSPTGISFAAEPLTLNGVGVNGAEGALRSVGGANTWTGPVTLASNSRINADTTGTTGSLTVAGNVAGGSNVLYVGANGAAITVSGTISGAGGSQDGTTTSLFKDGASVLTLSAANTYTGDTRINAGTLTVASGGNLGDGSDVFISSGAALNLDTSVTVASVQETGNGDGGTVTIGDGAVLTVNGSGFNVFQNSIGGAGGLAIVGGGTTNLYGTQSYTGTTSVSAGRLATGVALATSGLDVSGGTFATSAADVLGDTIPVLLSGAGLYSLGGSDTIGSLAGTGGTVALGANNLTVGGNASTSYAGALTGSGTFSKGGSGVLSLAGASGAFTGSIDVLAGSLALTGSHSANRLYVAAGAALGGSGILAGGLTGAGLIEPGASPGILTVDGAVTPLAGMSFAFEMTGTGLPIWSVPTASLNDVLRVEAADPFSTALVTTNTVAVYFRVPTLATGDTFNGGFFVDDPNQVADLLQGEVAGATFQFFVMGDGNGSTPYKGMNYYTLEQFIAANPGSGVTGVEWNTVGVASADFAGGPPVTTGEVTQFWVVPEPGTLSLLGCGLATWAAVRRRARRRGSG